MKSALYIIAIASVVLFCFILSVENIALLTSACILVGNAITIKKP